MSPSRFQVSPVREISSSRDTLRSTIHFWRKVRSLKVKVLPLGCRRRHSRAPAAAAAGGRDCAEGSGLDAVATRGGVLMGGDTGRSPGGGPAGAAGCVSPSGTLGAWGSCPGFTGTVTTSAFFFTTKTWWHVVHWTVTPVSEIRESSRSYCVLQRSHRTSMHSAYHFGPRHHTGSRDVGPQIDVPHADAVPEN